MIISGDSEKRLGRRAEWCGNGGGSFPSVTVTSDHLSQCVLQFSRCVRLRERYRLSFGWHATVLPLEVFLNFGVARHEVVYL